jgi:hypothetical protein
VIHQEIQDCVAVCDFYGQVPVGYFSISRKMNDKVPTISLFAVSHDVGSKYFPEVFFVKPINNKKLLDAIKDKAYVIITWHHGSGM